MASDSVTLGKVRPRVLFLGNLANGSFRIAKALRSYTPLEVDLLDDVRPELRQQRLQLGEYDWVSDVNRSTLNRAIGVLPSRCEAWARRVLYPPLLLPAIRQYDLIVSSCMYGMLAWASGRKYLSIANGDDIKELALQDSGLGRVMRRAFQKAQAVFVASDPGYVSCLQRLGISRYHYIYWPYDLELWKPQAEPDYDRPFPLIFLASRLDFRPNQKGNDRFIRAFARYSVENPGARLIMLEQGDSLDEARELVADLGISDRVIWRAYLGQAELMDHFHRADLVVDQFEIGSFGATAIEAMACGSALMTYIDKEYSSLQYPDEPPLINVRTEDDILAALRGLDRQTLSETGRRARRWIENYHDEKKVALYFHSILEQYLARTSMSAGLIAR